MPVYEHKLTGERQALLPEQAELYGDVFTMVEEESAPERKERELREAIMSKVEIEEEDDLDVPAEEHHIVAGPKNEGDDE